MNQIFLSYRREDSADVSGRINDRLAQHFGQDTIFTDVDSIPLGIDFQKYIDKQVGKCDIFLAVIGRDWLTVTDTDGRPRLQWSEDIVRIEVESALRRNIPVIPLLVRGATMPSRDDLPKPLNELATRNGIPIRPNPDFHRDMERLIKGIEQHLSRQSKEMEKRKAEARRQTEAKKVELEKASEAKQAGSLKAPSASKASSPEKKPEQKPALSKVRETKRSEKRSSVVKNLTNPSGPPVTPRVRGFKSAAWTKSEIQARRISTLWQEERARLLGRSEITDPAKKIALLMCDAYGISKIFSNIDSVFYNAHKHPEATEHLIELIEDHMNARLSEQIQRQLKTTDSLTARDLADDVIRFRAKELGVPFKFPNY